MKTFAADHEVSGVMTYMEHHVVSSAEIAQQLGLPACRPEAISACRARASPDDFLTGTRCRLPAPRWRMTPPRPSHTPTRSATRSVVKPRAMAGSAGVVRVDTASEVRAADERASHETVLGLDQ